MDRSKKGPGKNVGRGMEGGDHIAWEGRRYFPPALSRQRSRPSPLPASQSNHPCSRAPACHPLGKCTSPPPLPRGLGSGMRWADALFPPRACPRPTAARRREGVCARLGMGYSREGGSKGDMECWLTLWSPTPSTPLCTTPALATPSSPLPFSTCFLTTSSPLSPLPLPFPPPSPFHSFSTPLPSPPGSFLSSSLPSVPLPNPLSSFVRNRGSSRRLDCRSSCRVDNSPPGVGGEQPHSFPVGVQCRHQTKCPTSFTPSLHRFPLPNTLGCSPPPHHRGRTETVRHARIGGGRGGGGGGGGGGAGTAEPAGTC